VGGRLMLLARLHFVHFLTFLFHIEGVLNLRINFSIEKKEEEKKHKAHALVS